MITGFMLAAGGAATAASRAATEPAAGGGAAGVTGGGIQQDIIFGAYVAWFVLSIVALVKLRVFAAAPLNKAPQRTAIGLLPLAFATIVLYFILQIAALTAAFSTGWLARPPEEPAPRMVVVTSSPAPPIIVPPATTLASTAPATTTRAAPENIGPDDPRSPVQKMRLDTLASAMEMGAILIALVACAVAFSDRLRGMGLWPLRAIPAGFVLGTVGYILLYPLLWMDDEILSAVYSALQHQITIHPIIEVMTQTPSMSLRMAFALVAGIGAPLAEEIFFRGILQSALIQRGWGFIVHFPADRTYRPSAFQRWSAIVLCSMFFCSLHPIDHAPILFLLSLTLGYIYERTGNLWASITIHALFNWTSLIMVLRG